MKHLRKLLTLVVALVMTLGLVAPVFADENTPHTITIDDTDQNVSHTFKAYQVFKGTLNEEGQGSKLSNIDWGSGVNGTAILTALKATDVDEALTATAQIVKESAKKEKFADETAATAAGFKKNPDAADDADDYWIKTIEAGESLFKFCETAQDVADVISGFESTGKYKADGTINAADGGLNLTAGQIDAFASIVAKNLKGDGTAFTEKDKKYTAEVTGDGYYFVKDTTTDLVDDDTKASDTLSKYLLAVVRDTEIVAKDTGLTPDKKILGTGTSKLAADSAAIGDTVKFEVTIDVPNTTKYEDHFVFVMNDTLPAGITFTGITSVKVDGTEVKDVVKENATATITAKDYDGTNGYYTLKVNGAAPAFGSGEGADTTKYTFEQSSYDAVKEAGGQKIEITFNQFKKFVEKNNLIGTGKKVTIQYTGVVNDDASYKATANENEVTFDYSNDPNHDYGGDNITGNEPHGTTPEVKTRSYTTSLKIKKVDENGKALAGAIFTLTGDALNRTVLTGDKFEPAGYTAKIDEVVQAGTYWKLKDGTYTTTDPKDLTNTSMYESTTDTYVKVSYTADEVAEKSTSITIVTNSQGIAEFIGLDEGEYTLEEIAAPEGFNKINGTSTITIGWSDPEAEDATSPAKDQGGYTLTATGFAEATEWNGTDKQFEVTIENKSGTELPSTGGMGTTLFYVVGTMLVLGAGVVLVSKRRISE